MRKAFTSAIIQLAKNPNNFFLSGDLGFMALEDVRSAFGNRFLNAGVSEQNMIGVAAGLAKEGFTVYAYSIAPFIYARPYEQIRNDLCMLGLPVCLVGNGGGYAYGHMGPTHHALEDCAAMLALGVQVVVPAFDEDLPAVVTNINGPVYLRLGYDSKPQGFTVSEFAPWRKILIGAKGNLVALGPLAGVAAQALIDLDCEVRPNIWAVSEFSDNMLPDSFLHAVLDKDLYVIEEHRAAGGLGMTLASQLFQKNIFPKRYFHRFAIGYPTGTYGSQEFHRKQCGLDCESIRNLVLNNS